MKKLLSIILSLLILFSATTFAEETTVKGTIKVGVDANFAPFEYYEDGKLSGFDIELMNYIGEQIGYNIEYVDITFDALIPAILSGRVDCAVSAMTVTEEREEVVDFTTPYLVVHEYSELEPTQVHTEKYGIVFKSGLSEAVYSGSVKSEDEELFRLFEVTIGNMIHDDTIYNLIEKYNLDDVFDKDGIDYDYTTASTYVTDNDKESLYAQNEPVTESGRSVYIDGVYTGIKATEIDGTEYLPVKALCEVLGYNINEITENVYLIGEGENCKNSESTVKSAKFTLGEDYVISYSKDGQYENKIETFPSEPITVKIGDEIYMPSYYFGRMLEIKTRFAIDNKSVLITVNEQKEQAANRPEYRGNIFVKNHDDYLEIEVDNTQMTFMDKPFIDADGRVQVPVREFCEQLNFGVTWFENPGRVSVSSVPSDLDKSNGGSAGGASVWFTIGERQYRINGTYYDMDTEAQIINDRTYVPMRYLAEALNYYVAYNPSSPANLDMGYGYKVLNSYLGLDRDLVLREAEIDESFMLKIGNDDFPIREHDEGNMYIIKNGYKKGDVVLEFYNDVLCAFHYVFKTEGEAFDEALDVYDYFVKLYGEADTYPNTQKTISKIGDDEGQYNDEVCSYYDEWIVDAPSNVIETLLGEADNGLMKMVRMDINPKMSVVRVSYSKDLNFHNRIKH